MPFSPDIAPEVKPELTLEGFLQFAESKDPAEEYDYSSVRRCALGQYVSSLGGGLDWNGHDGFDYWIGDRSFNMRRWRGLLNPAGASADRSFTWGALADRLRAAIKERGA